MVFLPTLTANLVTVARYRRYVAVETPLRKVLFKWNGVVMLKQILFYVNWRVKTCRHQEPNVPVIVEVRVTRVTMAVHLLGGRRVKVGAGEDAVVGSDRTQPAVKVAVLDEAAHLLAVHCVAVFAGVNDSANCCKYVSLTPLTQCLFCYFGLADSVKLTLPGQKYIGDATFSVAKIRFSLHITNILTLRYVKYRY